MIVSRSHNFVFAHIPKTGGISVRHALEPFASDTGGALRNEAHDTLAALMARRPELGGLFKFAFVRNPWERLVSFYFNAREKLAKTVPQMQTTSFRGMLAALDADAPWAHPLYALRPQIEFVRGGGSEILADFIGRFERLEADFAQVCRRVGISGVLARKNTSTHGPYATYYDDWSRGFVAARFALDIETFGYTFESAP